MRYEREEDMAEAVSLNSDKIGFRQAQPPLRTPLFPSSEAPEITTIPEPRICKPPKLS